uniref:Response regulator receiver protein n=1 Tax=uncultured bacterium A1Q1_fos_1134 TaxID=1256543 RepID=L7VY41_9BACT|nr:response regulator receiver protein [uncultured bacterium A1Q1_fos_1134]
MKRILIVDDQCTIRWMIRLALREDFAVDEADNPQAAWGMIKKRRPDGIVLDVMMPGGTDGFQFCKRIKTDPGLASINVVLVTACGEESDRERGRLAGANGYFVKPLSPLALARHFRSALKNDDDATPLKLTGTH